MPENEVRAIAPGVCGTAFLDGLALPAEIARQQQAGAVPGMLSEEERAMLVRLVGQTWRGDGAIIDGGSFFGSSLVAEAQGLELSPRLTTLDRSSFPQGKPIHGYELGFLPAPGDPNVDRRRTFGGVEYHLGDNFVPILERTVAPYRDHIALHIGDLNNERWDGSPIEIAFIDVCKTPQLNAHVAREFLPAMIGGASTLINQDFFFDRLPWIRVTMGYLADYYRWEGQVYCSSVYTSIKPVPIDVATYDPFLEGTFEDCLRYHDAVAFDGIGRRWDFRLALSRGWLMAHKGRRKQALDYVASLGAEYDDVLADEETGADAQRRLDRTVGQIASGVLYRMWGWSGVEETVDGKPTTLPLLGDAAAGTARLGALDLPRGVARLRERARPAGMTSGPEQALLEELVATTWRGDGAIVDVGSFLGATMVAEAEGLRAHPAFPSLDLARFPDSRPIHGFERGFFPAPASPAAKRDRVFGDVTVQLGDSFVPRLERAVAPYRKLVRLHIGDLHQESWDGSPVELAFVDAAASADVSARVAAAFYPALIGGGSTLVVRDVYSDQLPWLNVTLGYLTDHLRWEGQVRASAVFSCVAQIPVDVAAYDPYTHASLAECLRYHDAVDNDAVGSEWQFLTALSRIRLVATKGDPDGAVDLLREVEQQYADLLGGEPDNINAVRLRRVEAQLVRG